MAIQPQGGGLWLCCSQCTQPQVCPLLPCEQHLTWREGSAPGEPPPLPQVSNRPSSGSVSGFQREIGLHPALPPLTPILSFSLTEQ